MDSTTRTTASPDAPPDWHALTPDAALAALDSRADGLTTEEAVARLATVGPNSLPSAPGRSLFVRFLLQFHDVLIYVLLASGGVVLLLGHALDAAVIFGVTVINAIIGVVQEGRAEQALAAIRNMLTPTAAVVREGMRRTLDAEDIVPGDVVHLESGDRVPADVRLIEAQDFNTDEAALTGESMPVGKLLAAVDAAAPLAERTSMAYAGTLVTRGRARAVVVATGARAEIGRITTLMADMDALETPLTRKLAHFGRVLTAVIVAAGAVLLGVGVLRGRDFADTFLAVVGLAVAAIPEGLPAIVTIALAIGVRRMATHNAIVRRLPSVETLGSVTVICTDKTGTLTRNEMSVARVVTPGGSFRIEGTGYAPTGRVIADDSGAPLALAEAAVLCNDARLRLEGDVWHAEGDPMEAALLAFAGRAGADVAAIRDQWSRVDTIPFEAERRFMATLHGTSDGVVRIVVKGAPEAILPMCTGVDAKQWNAHVEALGAEGMRVLAFAGKVLGAMPDHPDSVVHDLDLLGCTGFIDPPREEAITAVAQCQAAGIRVKMITGDHAVTAAAIARQVGLRGTNVTTGTALVALDPAMLAQAVADTDVFARASPEHKLVIVEALQRQGHVVAMTGDGVNDAPSLKRANVGVAMGVKGTEAAREAASIVLADDNFASIAHAVEGGRTVYENIRKAILYILPTNGAESVALVAAILFGLTMPITPVQILWINMVTEVTLSVVIAFDPTEPGIMDRPPRDPAEPLLSRLLLWRLLLVTSLLGAAVIGIFYWGEARTGSELVGRTLAVNALVMGEIFYLFNMRSVDASSWSLRTLTGNPYALPAVGILLVLQAALTHWSPMQALFGTTDLDAMEWLACVAVGAIVFVAVEVEKAVRRGRHATPVAPHS
jgi:calcium-translocating P-type ATPase